MMPLISNTGEIQRVDALLRARFPNLVTRIFEITPRHYVIAFDPALQDAKRIEQEFHKKIRFAHVAATLSNEAPVEFIREVSGLSDKEAAGSIAGLPLRTADLLNLLAMKFPELPWVSVRDEPATDDVHVLLCDNIDNITQAKVQTFFDELRSPLNLRIDVVAAENAAKNQFGDNPMFIQAARLRPHAPSFIRRDEAFWFDNIKQIGAGDMPVERFPGFRDGAYRCYLDLTLGVHLNLRQALLLYDEIYCSLPLAHDHAGFLAQQKLSDNDLLEMIEAGRLKIVTTQPEERLRLDFLEEVDERQSDAIIGRRTTAALLMADVARTAELFRLNDPSFFSVLPTIAAQLAPALGVTSDELLRSMLWPLEARRSALQQLLDQGSKGGPALTVAQIIARRIKANADRDVELEAMMLSERVHIGHALNATVFGQLDEPPMCQLLMSLIGHDLNFYRSFNKAIAAAWVGNEQRRAEGIKILPTLPLFEFDPKTPIQEILEDSSLGSTRAKGRALFARLAELPVDVREAEVDALTTALRKKRHRKTENFISLDNADTALAVAGNFFDFLYPPLAGLKHVGGQIAEKLRRIPAVDDMLQQLELDTLNTRGGNQDLDFLSRINRVAEFRRERI